MMTDTEFIFKLGGIIGEQCCHDCKMKLMRALDDIEKKEVKQ